MSQLHKFLFDGLPVRGMLVKLTDTWTEIINAGAPSPRLTSAVLTGDGLLTFGGYNGSHLNDTWFYSPQRTLYPYTKQ